jgi:hypothetical protein
MKPNSHLICVFLQLLFLVCCKDKETKKIVQAKTNIFLSSKSANVSFRIKDNKVASYEITNEDGSPIGEQIVYQQIGTEGESKCYRCPANETDMTKCESIKCPYDPCGKEIYCGPLNFEINDAGATKVPGKAVMYSLITTVAK